MMKYWILGLPMLIMACANTVEVEDQAEYKCGEQIVQAEMLDDNSMIVTINGVKNVLSRVAASTGERYENIATKVSFMEQDGDKYLSIQGRRYPMCQRITK